MKTYIYIYKLWSIHHQEWQRFVGSVTADSFEQAEWKVSLKYPDYENLGELVGLVDEESGLKIDFGDIQN